MMRTQPPGFRWLVGGFALVASIALGWHYLAAGDRGALVFAVLALVAAGYWLVFDREPE
jgi:type II secretory pathway component PulM